MDSPQSNSHDQPAGDQRIEQRDKLSGEDFSSELGGGWDSLFGSDGASCGSSGSSEWSFGQHQRHDGDAQLDGASEQRGFCDH